MKSNTTELPRHAGVAFSAAYLQGLFCIAVMFLYTAPFFELLRRARGQDSVSAAANSGAQSLLNISAILVSCVLIIPYARHLPRLIASDIAFWVFIAFIGLSTLWSADPSRTLHAAESLAGVTVFAIYFSLRFSSDVQITIVSSALLLALVASLIMIVVEPQLGIDAGVHAGQWRGVYSDKNMLGNVMALAVLAWSIVSSRGRGWSFIGGTIVVAALAMLVLSHSRGSLASAAIVLIFVTVSLYWRPRVSMLLIATAMFTVVCTLVWLAWSQRSAIGTGIGSEDTFAGRALMWLLLVPKIAKHPVLGYGYQAFWGGRTGDYLDIWQSVGWSPPHAHNVLVDVTLELGVVGLVLFLTFLVRASARALRETSTSEGALVRLWSAGLLLLLFLLNLTGSTLLHPNLFWILLVTSSVSTAKEKAFSWSKAHKPRAARVAVA